MRDRERWRRQQSPRRQWTPSARATGGSPSGMHRTRSRDGTRGPAHQGERRMPDQRPRPPAPATKSHVVFAWVTDFPRDPLRGLTRVGVGALPGASRHVSRSNGASVMPHGHATSATHRGARITERRSSALWRRVRTTRPPSLRVDECTFPACDDSRRPHGGRFLPLTACAIASRGALCSAIDARNTGEFPRGFRCMSGARGVSGTAIALKAVASNRRAAPGGSDARTAQGRIE